MPNRPTPLRICPRQDSTVLVGISWDRVTDNAPLGGTQTALGKVAERVGEKIMRRRLVRESVSPEISDLRTKEGNAPLGELRTNDPAL
jgi:hypothetical protein